MCLIVVKPAGLDIPAYILRSALDFNQDGVGACYMQDGKTVVRKWLDIKAPKLERKMARLKDLEVCLHLRMATHGRTDVSNIHPFPAHGNAWVAHNGVLHQYAPLNRKDSKTSDTREFIDKFLSPLLAKSDTFPLAEIQKEIAGNALLIMTADGVMQRLGSGWNQLDGIWVSNCYAFDHPDGYSLTDGYELGTAGAYYPGQFARSYNRNYGIAPYPALVDTHNGIPTASAYQSHSYVTCDDLITEDLRTMSDDIDLSNDDNIALEDAALYNQLLYGTMPVDEFLQEISATTKLALYTQLVRHEKV